MNKELFGEGIFLSTKETVEGYKIKEEFGLVFKAGHVGVFDGGNTIFNEITEAVKSIGGNAIIGLKMAESYMPDGKYHLLVYGTAVVLEKNNNE